MCATTRLRLRVPQALIGALLVAWANGAAQQTSPARIVNAKTETRSAAAGLEKAFRSIESAQSEPAWIGYAAPATPGHHQMCCGSYNNESASCCERCRLENEGHGDGVSVRNAEPATAKLEAKLEAVPEVLVLFRVGGKKVVKIRVFSADCELDAGGRAVYWLTDVQPAESVRWLASLISAEEGEHRGEDDDAPHLTDGALAAIAFHADPEADAALEHFIAAGQPDRIREKAAFWMGTARGRRGYEVLDRMVRHDASDSFRDKAVFALFVSHEPKATDTIIEVARNDSSPRVRGQALFWLAQKAGRKTEADKATSAIRQAIDNDPETEVKKKAVFALSQLPKDQGVPLLIQVAQNNRNPEVRKQAMFWLGQSGDPRALTFFENVLTH